MGLFDFFRRPPPIRDLPALADFIDGNAAFVVQKGIYEYSRARAGHYSKVLFAEPEFHHAVEFARWRAYPLGLAMVAEVAEAVLRTELGGPRQYEFDSLRALVLSVFDRYPVPGVLSDAEWRELRGTLNRRLQLIGLHPPKRAMDIPLPFIQEYFDLLPIHEKLRGRDLLATSNYLKVTMCNVHDDLTKRVDAEAVAGALTAQVPTPQTA